MRVLDCPFCGHRYVDSGKLSYVRDNVVFETAISYIECPCGAVYCPERLRVNHGEVDEGD